MTAPRPSGHAATISAAVTALGLLTGALGMAWHSSAILTGLQGEVAALRGQFTTYQENARTDTTQQIGALDRRVTALETGRTDADRQLATTAASIAGLQAQTTAMQGAINDMRDGIRSIQADIANMARTANAPLPRR